MLFPIHPDTPQCKVFEILNTEVLHFLEKSINAKRFNQSLFTSFSDGLIIKKSACWTNKLTKEKFKGLWNVLPKTIPERQAIYQQIFNAQDVCSFFNDTNLALPLFTQEVHDALKNLTAYLYIKTKDLADIKKQAGESIEEHYQNFIMLNSELCWICGTAQLSQNRTDIRVFDQWRADYDHILCKDTYPAYTVHPANFIPTCHICNSKAKGAKNLLVCPETLNRRKAFYPLVPLRNSCCTFIKTQIILGQDLNDSMVNIRLAFAKMTPNIENKIQIWDGVYQISARVTCHLTTHFYEKVDSQLRANDFNDFQAQLERHSRLPSDCRKSEWSFWWFRLYEFLKDQDNDFLLKIWNFLEWKKKRHQQEEVLSSVFHF
ncbi:hypothetical protein EJJ36_06655 [Acinetobacter junii]|nr:hypothetical protein [Acinetobacter junii]RTE46338.1 hypothetical protein EJJ36_06655 [Acinetobacter junii]